MTHFSLATFKINFLPLCFDSLSMMCLDMDLFWVSPTWNSLNFLDVHINDIHNDIHYFFKYPFCSFLSFSPFWDYHYAYSCLLEKIPLSGSCYFYCIPQVSEALLILSFVCFFFFMWEVNISETNKWGISESKHLLKLSEFF